MYFLFFILRNMLYAKDSKGNEKLPRKRERAICPQCGGELIAKCGSQKVWHWAHTVLDCDRWTEPESSWHKSWKEIVPRINREVTIGAHRADIRLDSGLIIELQNSSISSDEIQERERFYGDMIWIFNATKFATNCTIAECSKTLIDKPKYRSSGTDFSIFSEPEGYFKLINFKAEQDKKILEARERHENKLFKNNKEKQNTIFSSSNGNSSFFASNLMFAHKSYVPFVGDLRSVKSSVLVNEILTRPIYFRWRWFSSSLASVRKPTLWDVGSNDVLIFFPNGIADVFARARMLHDRRKLKRPSDLCAWVVSKWEILERLGVPSTG